MDFVSYEVYNKLPASGTKGPYTVTTLPAGSTIYRTDPEGRRDPSKGVPNFFGDKQSIAHLGRGNPDAMSSYTTSKDLTLYDLSFQNLIAVFEDDTAPEELKDFIGGVYIQGSVMTDEQRAKLVAQGIPAELLEDPDKPIPFIIPASRLPTPEGAPYPNYTNRALAEMICAMGFDGWIAHPGQLIQRNLDTKYYAGDMAKLSADAKAGTIHYAYNAYMPEIVLCDWSAVAERKSGGARSKTGRRARKGTRRGRKGRS